MACAAARSWPPAETPECLTSIDNASSSMARDSGVGPQGSGVGEVEPERAGVVGPKEPGENTHDGRGSGSACRPAAPSPGSGCGRPSRSPTRSQVACAVTSPFDRYGQGDGYRGRGLDVGGRDELISGLVQEMPRYISAAVRFQVAVAHQLDMPVLRRCTGSPRCCGPVLASLGVQLLEFFEQRTSLAAQTSPLAT